MSEIKIVDITVETAPVTVFFDCPHCAREIEYDYNEFVGLVGEVCDWEYSKFNCDKCNKEIEINSVDWD